MRRLGKKYNKIKDKMSARAKDALVSVGQKIANFGDLESEYLKNSLAVFAFIFLGAFSLIFFTSVNNIEKDLSSIELVKIVDKTNPVLEKKIRILTAGYPIENMSRYIALEDEEVAAFIVSIAKKESNWGKRTPKLNGKECYNYWGFREKREKMGSGGHTCFDNPKDAVRSVAKRIKDLQDKNINTPEKMIVWKCGYSCAGHSEQSVQKWINDVKLYYNKI